uniref:Uncharacterized protein n=1 Tax=Utricularia reniformis TaxID=192314 RepID=A0A1Y0B1R4_9LAMI|nr:hypothetical protein AEK19_MT1109 [Utricularia reniformis]ART31328.1 hypothetical protein AEK19_MT1109 [Utricularia reniformis]
MDLELLRPHKFISNKGLSGRDQSLQKVSYHTHPLFRNRLRNQVCRKKK